MNQLYQTLIFYMIMTFIFIVIIHNVAKSTEIELITLFGFINSVLLFFNLQISLNKQIQDMK